MCYCPIIYAHIAGGGQVEVDEGEEGDGGAGPQGQGPGDQGQAKQITHFPAPESLKGVCKEILRPLLFFMIQTQLAPLVLISLS